MKKIKIIILFMASFPGILISQVVSLDSVIRKIESSHLSLQAYAMNINAMKSYAEMSKSWMPSQFSAGIWQTPYSIFRDGMVMVSASQMLPNKKQINSEYAYMQSMAEVEKQSKAIARNELIYHAKSSYMEWVVLKRKLALLEELKVVLSDALKIAESKYAYNKEKLSNIYKARAEISEIETMRIRLMADMKVKNMELDALMGLQEFTPFDIDTNLKKDIPGKYLIDSINVSGNPGIKKMDMSIASLKLQQDYMKTKSLPGYGFSVSHMQSLGMMPSQYSIMAMMSVPVFAGSTREFKAKVNGIKYEMNALELERKSAQIEINSTISILNFRIQSMEKELANTRDNVLLNYENAYKFTLTAYEQNQEELGMVLESLRLFKQAKLEEANKWNEYYQLKISLEKERGFNKID